MKVAIFEKKGCRFFSVSASLFAVTKETSEISQLPDILSMCQ